MVLPFLALGAMALGGVVSAVGKSKSASQAKRADEADRKAEAAAQKDLAKKSVAASKVPLKESLKQTTSYGQKVTTSYGQKVTSTGSIGFARMVADAEAAGINPLTALRAGALSGYMSSSTATSGKDIVQSSGKDVMTVDRTTTGHNAHLAAVTELPYRGSVSSISPSGEAMQSIGGTISDVSGAGLQHLQHMASLQTSMATASMAYGGNRSGLTGLNWNGGVGPSSRVQVSRPLGAPSYQDWTEEIPTVTNPFGFDWWHSNPRWSDIETGAEAAYGDVGGALFFPLKLGADIGYTMAKNFENATGFNPRDMGPAVVDWLTSGGSWASMGAPPEGIPQITVRRDPAFAQ